MLGENGAACNGMKFIHGTQIEEHEPPELARPGPAGEDCIFRQTPENGLVKAHRTLLPATVH